MLPNGLATKHLSKRLKVYQGSEHPHTAQNPINVEILRILTIMYKNFYEL